jgi:hypothetical protein
MRLRHLALALALGCAMPAAADCKWEWLCNGEGACKQMPLCGSLYDVPPSRPTESKPSRDVPPPRPTESKPSGIAPLTMRVNTFSGRGVKPGTPLTCEHIMRTDRTGRWYWTEACFCTDPERAKDKIPPFANIVRCDELKK